MCNQLARKQGYRTDWDYMIRTTTEAMNFRDESSRSKARLLPYHSCTAADSKYDLYSLHRVAERDPMHAVLKQGIGRVPDQYLFAKSCFDNTNFLPWLFCVEEFITRLRPNSTCGAHKSIMFLVKWIGPRDWLRENNSKGTIFSKGNMTDVWVRGFRKHY